MDSKNNRRWLLLFALFLAACNSAQAMTLPVGFFHNKSGTYTSVINGSTSIANASTASAYQIALAWWVPSGSNTFRVHIHSGDSLSGTGTTAISGVQIAFGTSNGSGNFASAPTVVSGVTIPASNALYDSPWFTASRGSDGKVMFSYSIPSGSSIYYNTQHVGYSNLSAAGVSAYPLSGTTASPYNILTVTLEIASPGTRYTVLGDSLAIGVGDSNLDNCAYRLLQTTDGFTVATAAVGGVKLQDYANYATNTWLWNYVNVSGSKIILEAGINDLNTRTLAQMQADYGTVVAHLRALGATRIVGQTLTPSGTYSAGDATRVSFNSWLMTLPDGIAAVIDAATTLQNPANHAQLNPSYDSGDTLHWNDAGNAAVLPVIAAQLL